jgi:hypothetical protein
MSISNRIKTAAGLCLAVALLSGCMKNVEIPTFLKPAANEEAPAQTVLNGVTIVSPDAYCVDQTTLRQEKTSGFAILANCDAVNAVEVDAISDTPVVYTVVVGARADAPFADNIAALGPYFTSDAGAAALSRSGDGADVRVLDQFATDGGVYYLHVRDASDGILTDAAETYWRAIFGVKRRTVSISVLGLRRHDLASDTAKAQLEALVAKILRENNADNG